MMNLTDRITPVHIKIKPELNEAVKCAFDNWHTPGVGFANPYIDSSPLGDVYLICSWSMYHSGFLPREIKHGRGHSWHVEMSTFAKLKCKVANSRDHRNGLTVIEEAQL